MATPYDPTLGVLPNPEVRSMSTCWVVEELPADDEDDAAVMAQKATAVVGSNEGGDEDNKPSVVSSSSHLRETEGNVGGESYEGQHLSEKARGKRKSRGSTTDSSEGRKRTRHGSDPGYPASHATRLFERSGVFGS